MSCYNPILIKDPRNLWLEGSPLYMPVPCGHCIGCLKKKQNDWSIRISEELKSSPSNCFITLTYRPESVPLGFDKVSGEVRHSLRKSDYQKFLKHLRINVNRLGLPSPRFFVCGEYGSKTFRPHYHIVVCGVTTDIIRKSLDYWYERFGFFLSTDIGLSNKDRQSVGMYVGKYSSKGIFIEQSPLMVDFIEKPFCEASHFLGQKYISERIDYFSLINEHGHRSFDDFCQDFQENFKYNNNGFRYSMPDYYRKYFWNHCDSDLFCDSVKSKTGVDLKNPDLDVKFFIPSEDVTKGKVALYVPSVRNTIALSLLHTYDSVRSEEFGESESGPDLQKMRGVLASEFSRQYSICESSTRKLDSFYQRSKL